MYAKLFGRITESSLMEESVDTRYVFVMLLAIADRTGHVIGTDVAIARRIHIAPKRFLRALAPLLAPDSNSNSSEAEGRRVLPSDTERGYRMVNYLTYRNVRNQEDRRLYMREYMRGYRGHVKPVNIRKPSLSHADTEADTETDAGLSTNPCLARSDSGESSSPAAGAGCAHTPVQLEPHEELRPFARWWRLDLVPEIHRASQARFVAQWDSLLTSLDLAYPKVELLVEAARAYAWEEANPAHRKTPRGRARFLRTWIERTQNAARITR